MKEENSPFEDDYSDRVMSRLRSEKNIDRAATSRREGFFEMEKSLSFVSAGGKILPGVFCPHIIHNLS